MSWKKMKLGEVLKNREGRYKPNDPKIAGLKRIDKINFSGQIFLSDKGSNTDMILIKKGDLVISGINVEKGALAVYEGDEDILATIHYSSYTFDNAKIDIDFLKVFLRSPDFIQLLKEQVPGGIKTEIKPKHILQLEVYFPETTEEQKAIAKIFFEKEAKLNQLNEHLTHQLTLISQLEQAILQEAVQGKLLTPSKSSSPDIGEVSAGRRGQELHTHPEVSAGRRGQEAPNYKNLNNLPHLKTFRKELRNNLTPAEAKLWTLLKGKQMEGRKFRRQFSVANYILDFYCPAEHLAIELDGQGHFEATQAEYDRERDLFLQHCGIKVLRFENKWVWDNPEGLLRVVKENFGWKEKYLPLSQPAADSSPDTGEQPEETGYELLQRIKAEKEKLFSLRGNKKGVLPPIKPEDLPAGKAGIPFQIPENWVWCRLGEIIEYTENLDIQKHLSPDTIINYVDIDAIDNQNFVIRETKQKTVRELSTRARRILKPNYIVYSTVRPYLKNIAIVEEEKDNYIGSTGFIVFKTLVVELKYAFYYLLTPFVNNTFKDLMVGFNSPSITNDQFEKSLFPLPPLSEQKRIVAEIEKQLAKTKQLKEHIIANQQATEQLLKALLHQAFQPEADR